MKNIPQDITDLILAVREAGQHYAATRVQFNVPELEVTLQKLTDCLGKFLSHLELQNEFFRLGIMIHRFDDVAAILIALNTMIVDRVEADQSEMTKNYIARLHHICSEVGRIRAAFTVEKSIHPDDEDFLHDLTYSDN